MEVFRPEDPQDPAASPSPRQTLRSLARGGRRYALPWLSMQRWHSRFLLVAAALLAGLASILFALGAEHAIAIHRDLTRAWPWASLLIAPAGFAAISWLTAKFFPGTEGSGIPQSVAASGSDDRRLRRLLLSPRIAIGKILLTLGGLFVGASIGREGPSVQIGASVMHMLAGRRHHRIDSSRNLIIAGGGAGVAAAFNTPLGGIMFAIEELSRHRAFQANSTTLTAVIFAGLMSLAVLGNYTYFGRTPAAVSWPDGLIAVLACGIAGGLIGGGFTRLLIASARGLPGRIGALRSGHPVRFAALCGLATALLGLATGGLTYGTGYEESRLALDGAGELPGYFMFAKLAAIWLAFISGIPGGIFAPALAVGAGLGDLVTSLIPTEQHAAVMVLGMVAFLSGMTQAPITSFVIVMEMTANHQMLLPLMAASVVAHGCARSVAPVPLYHALAAGALRTAARRLLANRSSAFSRMPEPERPAPPPAAAP